MHPLLIYNKMTTIRQAAISDIPFISSMILMALHIDGSDNERLYHNLTDLVNDDNTLYSWHRCRIACVDNISAGLCLAYDAYDYHQRRIRSFSMPCSDGRPVSEDNQSLLEQEDEAGEGEFYIDSLAVLKEYRHHGVGRMLMNDAIERGKVLNLTPTLLVDPTNDNAVRLYSSLGFYYSHNVFVFGQFFHKYVYK